MWFGQKTFSFHLFYVSCTTIFKQYFCSKVSGLNLPNFISFTEFVYKKSALIFKLLRSTESEPKQTAEDDAICPESVEIQDGTCFEIFLRISNL